MDPINEQDPELWVRDYQRMAQDLSRKAEEANQRFGEIEGRGANDFVRITVNSGGVIQTLSFTSQIRRVGEEELAERFMDAYAVAITAVNGQNEALIREITSGSGTDDQAMADYVRSVVPQGLRERAESAEGQGQS